MSVDGALQLAGPLTGSEIRVAYDPETGLVMALNDLPLPVTQIPGIDAATISVSVSRNPDTGEWIFGGAGSATLGIAGVTGEILVLVNQDIITITGIGSFSKGPVSGSLSITASNQARDDEGNPIEGQAQDDFTVFGRGGATVTFGSLLQGTVGIELTPDARVIITGEIGLPPTFEVFEERRFDKELLRVEPPEFPIWGISFAGIGIGIFAFLDARLGLDAFIGPGELRDTSVSVTFDLDAPEQAVVEGGATFFISAGAGLTLDIGGGIRARVLTAQASGRVGLDGRLGIEAEGSSEVNFRWTRDEGLSLDAVAEATARPKFEIGANAEVNVSVDLLIAEPETTFGPWRETLGEFGPELEVGITVPAAWSEARGLEFDPDDVTVRRPEISFADLMTSSFLELV